MGPAIQRDKDRNRNTDKDRARNTNRDRQSQRWRQDPESQREPEEWVVDNDGSWPHCCGDQETPQSVICSWRYRQLTVRFCPGPQACRNRRLDYVIPHQFWRLALSCPPSGKTDALPRKSKRVLLSSELLFWGPLMAWTRRILFSQSAHSNADSI